MSEELKPCPFCGKEPRIVIGKYATCETEGCPTEAIAVPVKKWNSRPVEDALQKRIAELEAENGRLREALKEIAEFAKYVKRKTEPSCADFMAIMNYAEKALKGAIHDQKI